jgi:hypothetical protein
MRLKAGAVDEMRALLSSPGSRRCGVSRGIHVIFVAILCISIVFSCIDASTAQPTVYANVSRNRDYDTPRDSVRYDESLTGRYTWDIWMGGESATPAAIEVLTKHAISDFGGFQPKLPNSTRREDSNYRYRWDVPDVSRMSRGVFLASDLEVTSQPGFDSERTVSPAVFDDEVTIQTLQVKVTPREGGFVNFQVYVEWEETREAGAALVPGSDQPRLNGQEVVDSLHSASWNIDSPVNGKQYEFSLQLKVENKLCPNKVVFKPMVMTNFSEARKSQKLSGSTVTVQDDILGEIAFSTPSTSRWQIDQNLQSRVHFEGVSSAWGSVGGYTTCKSLDQDGNPVERSRDFLTVDDGVTVWVNLRDLRISVDVKFEWYAVDGSLYREHSVTTPSPPEGEEGWNYAVHDSIEVRGKQPSRMLGDWRVKISVDGAEPTATGFTIRRAPSSISVSLSTQSVSQGESVLVTGKLQEAHEGVEIVLDYARPDGSTVKRTVTTEPDGSFSDRYSPDMSGAWTVTASWEGNEDYEGSSAGRSFTVTSLPRWMAAFGGYSILAAAITGVVIVSFVLFWRRRTRRRPAALKPVAAPPAARAYCIFCAAPIEPEQEFCMRCGKRQIRIEPPR